MNQLLFDIAEQHRRDLLARTANAYHLDEYRMTPRRSCIHAAALAWLGEQFIAWGWRLRARYGKVEHRPARSRA